MVCFFRKDRIFLPSPMVARNLSGSKSRLFVIVGRHTRLLAIILIQESCSLIRLYTAVRLSVPVARSSAVLSNFAQYCNGLCAKLVMAQKSSFPPRYSTAYLPFLRRIPFGPQHRESRRTMRAFYEKLGVLGPIYRLVGEGCSDREIAGRLRLSEPVVTNCIAWMLHSFKFTDRAKLVADAFSAARPSTSEAHLRAS